MSSILDFYVKPFQYNAFADYVIRNHPNYVEWTNNNYIQLAAKDILEADLEVDYFCGSVFGKIPLMSMIDHYEIRRYDGQEAYDIIVLGLEKGFKYYLFLDHFYIKSSQFFQKRHHVHDVLVVGRTDGMINFLENTDGFIRKFEISESEFLSSYLSHDNYCTFELNANNDVKYAFSIERFENMLNEYAFGIDSSVNSDQYLDNNGYYSKEFFEAKFERINCWGVNVYDSISRKTIELAKQKKFVDYRWYYLVMEKNNILCKKLDYCKKRGYIGEIESDLVSQRLNELSNEIKKNMNRVVKYVYSGFALQGIPEVGLNMLEIKKSELEIYMELLKLLGVR